MNKTILGTCSICGGCVSVPLAWWGIVPPEPTCERCGAKAAAHGPVIPMQPVHTTVTTDLGTYQIVENETLPPNGTVLVFDPTQWWRH